MTGCVHRRVIIEDLNRKASSAIGKFLLSLLLFGLVLLPSRPCFSLRSIPPVCFGQVPQLIQRSTPAGHSRPAEHLSGPHGQRSTPAQALSASGAPLRPSRPAEHPAPALSASGAPLRPSRPAEHPCTGPLGQRSTSPALTASGAPLHRPSRPAERLYRPLPGQRSAFRCQL
ncbi:uncharacterized protein Rv2082-like [Drosophila nasuta]|uniref:uncharacterized protein Rv2082-like n=1 Tax=Drosophila nasuta TaxID=42062 RepID=UPI00295E7FFE|nr:uncharacterized protein Rv2082-like [Drosophila nasuta]